MYDGWRLVIRTSGELVVPNLILADHFWPRFVGLQFRRRLPPGTGLLLVPCNSVHTCFLRFPIDLICLNRQGQVVEVRKDLRPWRAAIATAGTHAILETAAGGLHLEVGQLLSVQAAGDGPATLRRSLQFLSPGPARP